MDLAAHVVHLTDFQRGGGQGQLRGVQLAAVQCPHCALVVDSVVITAVTGLDVEVQPSVQLIELFRLRLGLDLLSRHTAILKGVVQFYTLVIGSRIKYLSGDKG